MIKSICKLLALFGASILGACANKYTVPIEVRYVDKEECSSILRRFSIASGKHIDLRSSKNEPCEPSLEKIRQEDPYFVVLKVVEDTTSLSLTTPVNFSTQDSFLIVKWVPPGSYLQGYIFPGDTILSINSKMVIPDSTFGFMLPIEVGTTVAFEIKKGLDIESKKVEVKRFESKSFIEKTISENSIYLYPSLLDQIFFESFNEYIFNGKVDTIVLDLRGVPGGPLNPLINFLKKITPKNKLAMRILNDNASRDPVNIVGEYEQEKIPKVIIFTDRLTSSGAEILAEAMKYYGIGTVVGENTRGIPVILTTIPSRGKYGIRVKTGEMLPPSGQSIFGIGCTPNFIPEEISEIGKLSAIFEETKILWNVIESETESESEK